MQFVPDRAADQSHQIGRAGTGGKAADEEPVSSTDGHLLH